LNRAEAVITIRADAPTCFEYATDPANVPGFMAGITRYQPQGAKDRGVGARFDSVADIAGRKFETVLAITEWRQDERMTVASSSGLKLKASWRFEAFGDGTTDVTLVNEYEAPGVFRLMGGLVRSTVEKATEQSLERLKNQVEAAVSKAPAARRRARKPTDEV
jgi:uncharacterized membrane protein